MVTAFRRGELSAAQSFSNKINAFPQNIFA